jgi:hypothetical protein
MIILLFIVYFDWANGQICSSFSNSNILIFHETSLTPLSTLGNSAATGTLTYVAFSPDRIWAIQSDNSLQILNKNNPTLV